MRRNSSRLPAAGPAYQRWLHRLASNRTLRLRRLDKGLQSLRLMQSLIKTRQLEVSLPPAVRATGGKLHRYEPIGGLTNQNYKLYLRNETLVLRLPGRGTGRFIRRDHEKQNQHRAELAGYTPPAVYFNRSGKKITRFLHAARPLNAGMLKLEEHGHKVLRLLKDLHTGMVRFDNRFDVFRLARTYERLALLRFVKFYDGYWQWREPLLALEALLDDMRIQPVACHNDLVPDNLLLEADRLWLIDWEYAGMNDPAWDLASLFLESDFSELEARHLLASYLALPAKAGTFEAEVSDGTLDGWWLRIRLFQCLQDYLWSIWALLIAAERRDPGQKEFYRRYGQTRFDRAVSQYVALKDGLHALA